MSKKIIAYWIVSIAVYTSIILFIPSDNPWFEIIIFFALTFYGLYLIRSESKKAVIIAYIYLMECQPYKCIESMKQYYKGLIKTQSMKHYIKLVYAIIYIDAGNVENAIDILYSLIDYEPKMSSYVRFWYLKAWCMIYFEKNKPEQMKQMLDQMKLIIDNCKDRNLRHYTENYNTLLAKYYILTDVFLDNALRIFEKILSEANTVLARLNALYYMGLINLKKQDPTKALNNFTEVVQSGKTKLSIFENSKKMIELLS